MKIKLTEAVYVDGTPQEKGATLEVADKDALYLIRMNRAVPADLQKRASGPLSTTSK